MTDDTLRAALAEPHKDWCSCLLMACDCGHDAAALAASATDECPVPGCKERRGHSIRHAASATEALDYERGWMDGYNRAKKDAEVAALAAPATDEGPRCAVRMELDGDCINARPAVSEALPEECPVCHVGLPKRVCPKCGATVRPAVPEALDARVTELERRLDERDSYEREQNERRS